MEPVLNSLERKARLGVRSLRRTLLPCQTYLADHFSSEGVGYVSRIVLEKHVDAFYVKQFKTAVSGGNRDIREVVNQAFATEFDANEHIEQMVTCMELEHYEFIGERRYSIRELEREFKEKAITNLAIHGVNEFQRGREEDYCFCRPLVNGVRAFVWLDPYGNVQLKTHQGTVFTRLSSGIGLDGLNHVEGARGFVAEGVWDGARFFVTDVLFLHDTWLLNHTPLQRVKIFEDYACQNGMETIRRAKVYKTRVRALGALFSGYTKGLIVYTGNDRTMVAKEMPRQISFGTKKANRYESFDDNLKKLGWFKGVGELPLDYGSFNLLHLDNHEGGLTGLLV